MARQPKTAPRKKKFSEAKIVRCHCGAEKVLYVTKTGPTWQCSANIIH